MLLDTNVVSCLMRGDLETVKWLGTLEWAGAPPIVAGELLYEVAISAREQELRSPVQEILRWLGESAISAGTAERYAGVRAALKRKGRPIPENGIWIAACALEMKIPLATYDKHFELVEGLVTVRPPQPEEAEQRGHTAAEASAPDVVCSVHLLVAFPGLASYPILCRTPFRKFLYGKTDPAIRWPDVGGPLRLQPSDDDRP